METLADELVLYIFRFCGARDVAALEATCLRLASLARDDLLWRHLFRGWFRHHAQQQEAAAAADSGAADPFHALGLHRMDWPRVRSAVVVATNQDKDEEDEEPAVPRKAALVLDTEPQASFMLGGRRPFRPKHFEKVELYDDWRSCYKAHVQPPDVGEKVRRLMEGRLVSPRTLSAILRQAAAVLEKEPNLLHLRSPITVVGDLHGQLLDLLDLFLINGEPPDVNYLFLGNWGDRGDYGVETVTLLLALKAAYPDRVHLLRGKHETRPITQVYGLYDDCARKYHSGANVWTALMHVFDRLPLAAVVDDKVFCVSSGLSPELQTLAQIDDLHRCREVPYEGPMCDLVYSIPDVASCAQPPLDPDWRVSPQGAGWRFGPRATQAWLAANHLELMVTEHNYRDEGYQILHGGKLVTVYGAANYCERSPNVAACFTIQEDGNHYITQYGPAPRVATPVKRESLLRSRFKAPPPGTTGGAPSLTEVVNVIPFPPAPSSP